MQRVDQLIIALCFFLTASISGQAQDQCKTMQKHENLLKNDPIYKQAYEKSLRQSSAALRNEAAQSVTYKIPVVVHIMHVGEALGTGSNITDDQVYSAISSMNDAYKKKAGSIYDGNGVDMQIQFCLAQKDPNANATTGITRTDASATGNYGKYGITDTNEVSIKALSRWDNTKFYNIWVVTEIDGNGGGYGTQGYAYFPGTPAAYDGIVLLYNTFGYDPEGTRNYALKDYTNKNATAIHEMGHGVGLFHTFEGDSLGLICPHASDGCGSGIGDCCADIPAHKRSSSNCVSGVNACDGTTSRDLFIHNYMDYSTDDCRNMFTADQFARSQNQISSFRSNLVSAANLTNCGCTGNTAPIVRFYATPKDPCDGETVQFIDESLNFPSSYTWTLNGASPQTSTSQNPTATYNSSGPYDVTLMATSSSTLSNTLTKTAYITPKYGYSLLPFTESFEGSFPPANWQVISDDAASAWGVKGTKQWQQRTVGGSGAGTYAAAINLEEYAYPGEDDLVTPTISFQNITNPSMTFEVAYRFYSTENADTLQVLALSECGNVYTTLYQKGGMDLQSNPLATTPTPFVAFAPTTSADWRTDTIDLSAFVGQKIKLVFRSINEYGDNLYIDNVNITATYSTPVADFSASKTNNVAQNESITFTNMSTGGITYYKWDFGVGANPATATTSGPIDVTYNSVGAKTIQLIVTGPDGADTITKTGYVNVVTGILYSQSLESANIKVYPNPTKDVLHIDAGNSESVSVEVLDVLSNTVIEEQIQSNSSAIEINLSGKPQGVYLLLIKTTEGNFVTRVIKSN
jgi:PKD repeat protein